MRIKLLETPAQLELVRAMGSNDKAIAAEAQQAFAAFIAPVTLKVLQQASTAATIYTDLTFDQDDHPSIPLDLYYATPQNYVQVYMQSIAGGLPSSLVWGLQELKVATYKLDSAVSVMKKYARRARLDVISAAISRMSQEMLIKQERNAWAVILNALGSASTNGNAHVIPCDTLSVLQIDDFNRLLTRIKRINISFAQGTPSDYEFKGVTDLYISPEALQQVRSFVYQPMNTRRGSSGASSDTSTAINTLPESFRQEIFDNAGEAEVFGVSLHELIELGVSQKYNVLFANYATGNIAPGATTFVAGTHEVMVGVDSSRDGFKRPIARNPDTGSTISIQPDDQFTLRSDKLGWFADLEEGRVCIDSRSCVGLVM